MVELVKVMMWAVIGVFTYVFFVALNHIILEALR